MSKFWQHFINNGEPPPPSAGPPEPPSESEALDAYSVELIDDDCETTFCSHTE